MSEYGEEKELEEILQELVLYCAKNTVDPVDIKLHLPASILHRLGWHFFAKMRKGGNPPSKVEKLYFNSGTVELI